MEKIQVTYNGKTIEAEVSRGQLQGLIGDTPKTRPAVGDWYYFITSRGLILCEHCGDGASDNEIWSSGNGFFTEEEVEKELARRQAKRRIQDFIIENGLEFDPDWGSGGEKKYYIRFNYRIDGFDYMYSNMIDGGLSFYFKSSNDAQMVISNCEDDLGIIFGID